VHRRPADQTTPSVWRRLRDGSDHRVVKVYYSPAELTARLAGLGWTASIRQAGVGLLVGTARPGGDGPSAPIRVPGPG
jgi:demethylmenaquinone methyltransferase/2-methoxy-6-polyprenyl-1,4-benzoquinol methylase